MKGIILARTKTIAGLSLLILVALAVISGWYLLDKDSDNNAELFAITSYPTLLSSDTKEVAVNFKVYFEPGQVLKPVNVQLRQQDGKTYQLNDTGIYGDFIANDNVYGAIIKLDIAAHKAEDCLSFSATVVNKQNNIKSPNYSLCISGLPTRIAASELNQANRVDLDDNGIALADELLLQFETGVSEREIKSLAEEIGARVVGQLPAQRLHQLKLASPLPSDALISLTASLSERKTVAAASPNLVVMDAIAPTDAEFVAGNQHGLEKIFTDPMSIRTLWDIPGTAGGSSIFVLDSGVDHTHEDLSGINLSCVDLNDMSPVIGACGVGDEDSNGSSNGHGMRVIGAIAAQRDNPGMPVGIAGVVSASPIISVKGINAALHTQNIQGMDTIAGTIETLVATAFLPASNPVVVNFSRNLGGSDVAVVVQQFCAAVNNVVNGGGTPGLDRPAIVINSAGNNNSDFSVINAWPVQCKISSVDPNNASSHFEDANNDLLIIVGNSVSCAGGGVCADGTDDTRYSDLTSGSNFGSQLDVFAPGTSVVTPDTTGISGYSPATGTSLSAPLVAGAAALMLDCGVAITSINATLKSSAPVSIPFPGGSAGRISVFEALKQFTENIHGPLSLLSIFTLGSANLPIGTPINTVVANLSLANPLGNCNQVTYSVPLADPNFTVNGSNLEVKPGAILALGALAITVTAEDAYGRTSNTMLNFNVVPNAVLVADTDVVLVLDSSGSMNWPSATPGTSKLLAMQNAAKPFVSYLAAYEQHRLGIVQFNSAAVPFLPADEFPFQLLDTINQADAENAVDSVVAGGGTNIVDAIGAATAMVNSAPAAPRKVLVLFTDGKHNSPSTLSSAVLATALETEINNVNPGIDFYSIGFGTSINDAALVTATGNKDGWHLNEQDLDPMILGKTFTDVAAAVVGDVAIYDPLFYLSSNDTETLPVPVSVNDKNLSFVIRWETDNPEQIETLIKPPVSGCDINYRTSSSGLSQFLGENYHLIRVDLPYRCGKQLAHGGIWKVMLTAGEKVERERINVTTYAASSVKLESEVSIVKDRIDIEALWPDIPEFKFKQVKFSAQIKTPLPDSNDSTAQDKLGSTDDAKHTYASTDSYREFIPIKMLADKNKPNISYGSVPRLSQKGIYQIHLIARALDQNGQQIRRELMTSIYYQGSTDINWNWLAIIIAILLLLLFIYYWIRMRTTNAGPSTK